MRQFYEVYPKWNTVCSELSWSHYRLLMRIKEPEKREYYQKECVECAWSVRQLERQINSFYYERILATQFYLYAVCDVTPKLRKIAKMYNFAETPDKLGMYFYNDNINAYIEILSFNKIIVDAEKRNKILSDKLGI